MDTEQQNKKEPNVFLAHKLSLRHRLFATAGIGGLAIILFLYGGIFLQTQFLQDMKGRHGELQRESERIGGLKTSLAELSDDAEFAKEHREAVINFFLNPSDIVEFIGSTELIAAKNSLLISISSRQAGPVAGFAFQIQVWGSFPSIMRFIDQFSHGEKFVEIEYAQIQRIEKVEAQAGFRGKILREGDARSTMNVFVPAQQ